MWYTTSCLGHHMLDKLAELPAIHSDSDTFHGIAPCATHAARWPAHWRGTLNAAACAHTEQEQQAVPPTPDEATRLYLGASKRGRTVGEAPLAPQPLGATSRHLRWVPAHITMPHTYT